MAPQVFVSHATEDKQRFVVRFAQSVMGVDRLNAERVFTLA